MKKTNKGMMYRKDPKSKDTISIKKVNLGKSNDSTIKKVSKKSPMKKVKSSFDRVAFVKAKNKVFGLSNREDMGKR